MKRRRLGCRGTRYSFSSLAKAKAYEFPVIVPPLKVKGGTGSALRAFALAPR
ncbi:MAG TPA: hypothetical protein VFV04_02210 [Burkholderiales bacterium]|nr:hypothetical protein [Burkholderiales bacterium]